MRWSARGVVAALIGCLMSGTLATGAFAQASDTESEVILGFRTALIDELREVKTELATYNEWIDGSDWQLVERSDAIVFAYDRARMDDYEAAAELVFDHRKHPDAHVTIAAVWSGEDSGVLNALLRIIESGDLDLIKRQTADEKRAMLRPTLKARRAERDLLVAAIDSYDGVIDRLGMAVPSPAADAVAAEAPAVMAAGPAGLISSLRDELATDVATAIARIRMCRTAIDDADVAVYDRSWGYPGVATIDLARLPDYARVVQEIRDSLEYPRPVFAPASVKTLEMYLAFRNFTDAQVWPEDLVAEADDWAELSRQTVKERREICRPFIETRRTERDVVQETVDFLDEVLGGLPAPAPTTAPTPQQTSEPTPEPTSAAVIEPAPVETPIPDPFADY